MRSLGGGLNSRLDGNFRASSQDENKILSVYCERINSLILTASTEIERQQTN